MTEKMPCHISDGPKDPDDFPEKVPEVSFDEMRQELIARDSKLLFDISQTILYITKHSAFDHADLINLLKRCKRRIQDGFYG